jgi:hypothetical protein
MMMMIEVGSAVRIGLDWIGTRGREGGREGGQWLGWTVHYDTPI